MALDDGLCLARDDTTIATARQSRQEQQLRARGMFVAQADCLAPEIRCPAPASSEERAHAVQPPPPQARRFGWIDSHGSVGWIECMTGKCKCLASRRPRGDQGRQRVSHDIPARVVGKRRGSDGARASSRCCAHWASCSSTWWRSDALRPSIGAALRPKTTPSVCPSYNYPSEEGGGLSTAPLPPPSPASQSVTACPGCPDDSGLLGSPSPEGAEGQRAKQRERRAVQGCTTTKRGLVEDCVASRCHSQQEGGTGRRM